MSTIIKGFKVFNPDWTCRDFHYEVGKEYFHNGDIGLCKAGFHFCQVASDCFCYYNFNPENKVAEVEAIGLTETEDNKSVTNHIRIVREIPWQELLTIVNTGKDCTGLCNTGNWNTGNYNTGNYNTGNWNTGFFNTDEPFVRSFNKPTTMRMNEFRNIKGVKVLAWNYENSWWIYSDNMTDEEKAAHPEHETTGGYLKTIPLKEACAMMWERLSNKEKKAVRNIPNFNAKLFKKITGIEA